jgi:hypothetical protein
VIDLAGWGRAKKDVTSSFWGRDFTPDFKSGNTVYMKKWLSENTKISHQTYVHTVESLVKLSCEFLKFYSEKKGKK